MSEEAAVDFEARDCAFSCVLRVDQEATVRVASFENPCPLVLSCSLLSIRQIMMVGALLFADLHGSLRVVQESDEEFGWNETHSRRAVHRS